MPHSVNFPVYWIQMTLDSDDRLHFPFPYPESLRFNSEAPELAEQIGDALQKYLDEEENILEILPFLEGSQLQKKEYRIKVSVPKARDSKVTLEIDLPFAVIFRSGPQGIFGIIPQMGISLFARDEKSLEAIVTEAIQNEFQRRFRSGKHRLLLSTQWFKDIEIRQEFIRIDFHDPEEIAKFKKPKVSPILEKAAIKLDFPEPVAFGLEVSLSSVLEILDSGFLMNLLVVGPSGSGKTALIHELSRKLTATGKKAGIWETTASHLIRELTAKGSWESSLIQLCSELDTSGDFLFVRNFMELFEVGQYKGNERSVADFLLPFVSNGKVNFISECTEEELAAAEQKSPQYIPQLNVFRMAVEPDQMENIILKKAESLAALKNIYLSPEAIKEYLRLHKRYYPYSGLPGKAVVFIESLALQNFLKSGKKKRGEKITINRQMVIRHFCESSGMPAFLVDPEIAMNIDEVKSFFRKAIFGQETLVETLAGLMAVIKTSLIRTGKPIANCLFVGPTGVGKTEMAKVMAEFIFGSRERMIRFDMSEYSGFDSVTALTGNYHSPDGTLTSAVRRQPFSLLLFDEIEKAHPAFFDLLLQITGEGRLTDSRGRVVDFCSCIIIMTSNLGASDLQTGRISWKSGEEDGNIEEHFLKAVRNFFRLELLNRFDEILIFKPLSEETVRKILDKDLDLLTRREGISGRKLEFNVDTEVLDFIARKGYGKKYGARQLQRSLMDELVLPLARQINQFDYEDLLIANISLQGEKLEIDVQSDPLKFDLLLEEVEKNQWANHVSDLRRSLRKLKNGGVFIELMMQYNSLERKKRKQGDSFWKDTTQSEKHQKLRKYKETILRLETQIEAIEVELGLNCTGFKPYHTGIISEVRAWESAYLDFKQELYTGMYPADNVCHLGIYGKESVQLYEIYDELLDGKGFQIQAWSLWFRDAFYNEVLAKLDKKELEEDMEKSDKKLKNLPYLVTPIPRRENSEFTPPTEGDLFVGVVFKVEGPSVYLYLEEEEGLIHWYSDHKNYERYLLEITKEDFPHPENIHRRSAFAKIKERRIYSPGHLKDNMFKINRQVSRAKLVKYLQDTLDERFGKKLDRALN